MSESSRLDILNSYHILDTSEEEAYDEITQLASTICNAPISLISFVDDHRQWFKSRVGWEAQETPVELAFSAHAIRDPDHMMVVEDARSDERFKNNPLVIGDPFIRFYAGVPIVTNEGAALGTICVMDRAPKTLSHQQLSSLQTLSKQVMRLLETRKMNRLYESLFESTSDLVYELDIEGKYRYANRKVMDLLGYNASELRNIVCWSMVPEEYRQKVKAHHFQQIRERKQSIYSELPIKSKDGSLIWLRQTVDYTYDEKGRVSKTYVIAKDITDMKAAIEEQDNLVTVIAHDLKSPLNQIYGLSDLLKGELTGEHAIFNDMIQKVTVEGRKMIENLVYLKAYEKSGFTPAMAKLELKSFYEFKMKGFMELARKKELDLQGTCEVQDTRIQMDEGALSRIIDNLISNAIKFSDSGKEVKFNLIQESDFLQIDIQDRGPGFTDEDQKRLFQKFQKLSARPTGGERSTGLGLSIVHTLTTGLGGTIDLKTIPGIGSTFVVRLPLQENHDNQDH